jgi:flagellar biosynthesis/type III secretory pathway protein FliH
VTLQALTAFRQEKALTITVNPGALREISHVLASYAKQLQFEFAYKIEGDAKLPINACVIATEFEVLEASLDGQLQAILEALTNAAKAE